MGCRLADEIIEPETVIWAPANDLETESAGATVIPSGLTIEPLDCTMEPAGIYPSILVEICPKIGVGSNPADEIIVPEAVTCEPATGFFTVPAGATLTPVGLTTEPSACTIEPAGIF